MPEEKKTTEVKDQLQSLKQMLEAKGVKDGDILSKLAALEKTQEAGPEQVQTLSHRTVNQLQRAEKVCESTKKQIIELDKQWKHFQVFIRDKFNEQSKLYSTKRKLLVEKNQETRAKMVELRKEIQQAAVKPEIIEVPEDLYNGPSMDMGIDLTGLTDSEDEIMEEVTSAAKIQKTK